MTLTEFSNQFDVLYNNITSNQAPGLSEYEKSVFLTKAENEVTLNHFSANSKGNALQEGFDGSAKRQIDFSMLMRTVQGIPAGAGVNIHSCDNAAYYAMPVDILLYINEQLQVKRGDTITNLTVVPVSYQEYNRLMSKPFRRPLKNQAWRLITSGGMNYYTSDYVHLAECLATLEHADATAEEFFNTINGKFLSFGEKEYGDSILYIDNAYILKADATLATNAEEGMSIEEGEISQVTEYVEPSVLVSGTIVELIPGPSDKINNYIIRYVAKPKPIILGDIDDLTIDGHPTAKEKEDGVTFECELDPILHEEVLQRAVELAKIAWQGDIQTSVLSGQRSE